MCSFFPLILIIADDIKMFKNSIWNKWVFQYSLIKVKCFKKFQAILSSLSFSLYTWTSECLQLPFTCLMCSTCASLPQHCLLYIIWALWPALPRLWLFFFFCYLEFFVFAFLSIWIERLFIEVWHFSTNQPYSKRQNNQGSPPASIKCHYDYSDNFKKKRTA